VLEREVVREVWEETYMSGEYLLGAQDIWPDHRGATSTDTSGESKSEGGVEIGWRRCKDNVENMGRITTSFEVGETQGNINWL